MDEINQAIAESAEEIFDEAMAKVAERLPEGAARSEFISNLRKFGRESIREIVSGGDYQKFVEQKAFDASKGLANGCANSVIQKVIKQLPRGRSRSILENTLTEMSQTGIEKFCSGDSLEAIKLELEEIAGRNASTYIQPYSDKFRKKIYSEVKISGSGSRKINRHIKVGAEIFTGALEEEIISAFGDVLSGRKNLSKVAEDLAVNTTKKTAVNFTKQQGSEIAAEAIKTLAKRAEKELQNTALKKLATNGLNALANSNTLMQFADTAYEVGKMLKKLMNGEISKAEFIQIIGEKGTAVVISSYTTMIGGVIGGPIGAAIGGAIGSALSYFASSFIYGSFMKTFSEAEISRQRYEAIHAYCEYSIREMEKQRLEFESKVQEFLGARQEVIDTSLDKYEKNLSSGDFDGMSAALNGIAEEFGGRLQFRTFAEFDDFMSDKDSAFDL